MNNFVIRECKDITNIILSTNWFVHGNKIPPPVYTKGCFIRYEGELYEVEQFCAELIDHEISHTYYVRKT